jgi:hypothetical protein
MAVLGLFNRKSNLSGSITPSGQGLQNAENTVSSCTYDLSRGELAKLPLWPAASETADDGTLAPETDRGALDAKPGSVKMTSAPMPGEMDVLEGLGKIPTDRPAP